MSWRWRRTGPNRWQPQAQYLFLYPSKDSVNVILSGACWQCSLPGDAIINGVWQVFFQDTNDPYLWMGLSSYIQGILDTSPKFEADKLEKDFHKFKKWVNWTSRLYLSPHYLCENTQWVGCDAIEQTAKTGSWTQADWCCAGVGVGVSNPWESLAQISSFFFSVWNIL